MVHLTHVQNFGPWLLRWSKECHSSYVLGIIPLLTQTDFI